MPSKSLLFILIQRIWQGLGGVLTIFFIAHTLTSDMQGWFYSFASITSLYVLFELGLSSAIIQTSARFFVGLRWQSEGRVAGEGVEDFKAFISNSIKMYIKFAFLFFLVAFAIGFFIFHQKSGLFLNGRMWLWPWIALLVGTAINIIMLPFFAVVEGSGEISEVYGVRLLQGFIGSIFCWLVLLAGGNLWALSMMPIFSIFISSLWLIKNRPQLFKFIFFNITTKKFNWLKEVWPLQWRITITWIGLFLMSQLCTPILFYFQNSIVAGQMGLSLTIVHMLGILSQSWITRRIPTMTQAVAKREWRLLDGLFKKELMRSLIVFVLGATILLIAHIIISQSVYAIRVLDFWQFLGLLIFSFFYHLNIALAIQLRSFQEEPLLWIFLFGGIAIVICLVLAAKYSSVSELILLMTILQVAIISPLSFFVWHHKNNEYKKTII